MARDSATLQRTSAEARAAGPGRKHDLRAVKIVWQRELIRFAQDRPRILVSLLQPVLFLFVLGTGLGSLVSGGAGGVSLRTFLFPGVLGMAVMFTAMFSAASIVWDREFGFLREMLVAPVARGGIVLGKCLGGASVAAFQGVILLALAGTVGVPYSPLLILTLTGELLLLAFVITALGVLLAARIRSIQSFFSLTQMLLMPLFFLSGALFPLTNLPTWLQVLTHVNPLTYAVDPMRRAVFARLSPGGHPLSTDVTWGSWRVPTLLELALVAALALALLAVAVVQFRRPD
ncbi:MAG TPA: ABC transporter permease [Actinomycetota bacterium]|nr:ABC transporter permease [Actinomycetota bacterium]